MHFVHPSHSLLWENAGVGLKKKQNRTKLFTIRPRGEKTSGDVKSRGECKLFSVKVKTIIDSPVAVAQSAVREGEKGQQ